MRLMKGIKAARNRIPLGEYCFASRWPDGSPMDPWQVGFLDEIIFGENQICYKLRDGIGNKGRWFQNCRIITLEQGKEICEIYPQVRGHLNIQNFLKNSPRERTDGT